jgi:hypothetical protein
MNELLYIFQRKETNHSFTSSLDTTTQWMDFLSEFWHVNHYSLAPSSHLVNTCSINAFLFLWFQFSRFMKLPLVFRNFPSLKKCRSWNHEVCVCLPFHLSNQVSDFNEMWYERCGYIFRHNHFHPGTFPITVYSHPYILLNTSIAYTVERAS